MPATLALRAFKVDGATSFDPNAANDDFVHFCQVAALVITVYDHLITLDREVEYIWSRPGWSKSRVLFILARYFGDLLLVSDCFVFLNRNAGELVGAIGLKFVGTGSMVIIIITQLIMQFRIKALYGRTVSVLITILWVLEVIAVVSLGVASLVAIDVHPVVLKTAKMCDPTYLPPYAFLFWVPVIVFETFLFSLALRIAYRNYQDIGNWRGAALLHIVLRDNFAFFVCAFAIYITTATTWLTADPRYFTVPGSFSCALTTIMGCRLILNLCQAYHHPSDPDVTPPQSIWAATSGVRFRPPIGSTRVSGSAVGTRWSTMASREWKNSVRSHLPVASPNFGSTYRLSATGGSRTAEGSAVSTAEKTFDEEREVYEMRAVGAKAAEFGADGDGDGDGDDGESVSAAP